MARKSNTGPEPSDAEAVNQQGLDAADRGDLAAAERHFRRAQDLGSAPATRNLSVVYLRQRRWDEAEALVRPAAERNEPAAVYQLAVILHATGRDIEALFTRFTAAADAVAVRELAEYCRNSGSLAEAERFYRVAADRDDVESMGALASVLQARGDLGAAERWYRKAVARGNPIAMNNYGILLNQRGAVTEAVAMYRRAVAAGNTGALFNLGVALEDLGDTAGAETTYRQALKTGDLDVLNNLARLLRHSGKEGEAERLYRQAIAAGDITALHNLSVLLDAQGRREEAGVLRRRAQQAGAMDASRMAPTQRGGPYTRDVTAGRQTVDPETFRPR